MAILEKHYSVKEIADLWNYSHDTIRRIFKDEPGVLRRGKPESRFKRKRFQLSIPESVLQRVYQKMTRQAAIPVRQSPAGRAAGGYRVAKERAEGRQAIPDLTPALPPAVSNVLRDRWNSPPASPPARLEAQRGYGAREEGRH